MAARTTSLEIAAAIKAFVQEQYGAESKGAFEANFPGVGFRSTCDSYEGYTFSAQIDSRTYNVLVEDVTPMPEDA